jgi:PAS domain S-box-containing protein
LVHAPHHLLLIESRAELALPLTIDGQLIGILDLHTQDEPTFDANMLNTLDLLTPPLARAINKFQLSGKTVSVRNQLSLLRELSATLSTDLELEAILATAISFAQRFDASPCQIQLITEAGELYFASSHPGHTQLTAEEKQELARRTLITHLASKVMRSGQPVLIADTRVDTSGASLVINLSTQQQFEPIRSLICAPIIVEPDRLRGLILFMHAEPDYFDRQQLEFVKALATQVTIALKNAIHVTDVESSLRETHLMLDYSRRLSGANSLNDIYAIFAQGMLASGADRCMLHICDGPGPDSLPIQSEIVAIGDVNPAQKREGLGDQLLLSSFLVLDDLVRSQETLVVEDIANNEGLSFEEQEYFQRFGAQSMVVNPLVSRSLVIGFISIEYRTPRTFSERELALCRTLSNQTTIAIEHVRQIQRTETALAETQTLYHAGRVLAAATDLQEVFQEALVEFVYGLGLDQGGVTLLTPDRQYGQLMAYVQNGQLQDVEKLRFPVDPNLAYQQILLDGQPFVSVDAPNDPRLQGFVSFNQAGAAKSLLEAPMIIRGDTIGWIGADSVRQYRQFTQQEVDLARAMADQIAITIQNRRLLEQTERRATRLNAVAQVGQSISRMLDLEEIFNSTVELIRDRFGFYHVSIFLLDEERSWAVVTASTGEVGKIMVQRPHRLGVGSNSIVGYVTAQAKPRIALDVGEDAVHFKNPLLPDTRSELALPLIARGEVIGALDVQSTEVNAFSDEDIDTLQIMADQLANAIENARLFQTAHASRTFLQSVINVLPVGVFAKNVKQGYRFSIWNAKMEELFATKSADVLNKQDYDLFPKDLADYFRQTDLAVIANGQLVDIPVEEVTTKRGTHLAHTTKLPIYDAQGNPEVLLGVLEDITERKRAEVALQAAFDRTQALYRIGNMLATSTNQQFTSEVVLGEFLQLLNLKRGLLTLIDKTGSSSEVQAVYIDGQPTKIEFSLAVAEDPIIQHFFHAPDSFVVSDTQTHALTQDNQGVRDFAQAMLLIPLVVRDKVVGLMIGAATDKGHPFTQDDIEIGEAIAYQFTTWLENRQLLAETQRRSSLLQTAAEVSRAASSVLNVDALINLSVNLIRDQFDFYYVGLFLVDEAGHSAVLQAGTGEAGRIQLENHHQLQIGGESMIGWCIEHRQARIALDVGLEAVHFQNPYLPNTRSEMALPLISRGTVMGALTVQSTERGAFSSEDITLLQTMADHLANALENARLFAQSQKALSETENLYRITQDLLSARDEDTVYRLAIEAVAHANIDSVAIYMYLENQAGEVDGQIVEQKAVWVAVGNPTIPNGTRFRSTDMIVERLIPQHGVLVIEDTNSNDPRLTDQLRRHLTLIGIKSLAALPLSTYQRRLGFLLVANKTQEKLFSQQDIRFYTTVAQQMVVALENLRLLADSQRRAQREEIIRNISTKIRSATTIEDVLKTTVTELGQVLGATQAGAALTITAPALPSPQPARPGPQKLSADHEGRNGPLSEAGD